MKSEILSVERWGQAQPQRHDTLCSAHGKKSCARDLVATVVLRDAGSDHIEWTVCEHWLDHEPDVVVYDARQG
ncbi:MULTISPECIES: hypothetical protein [unclassified Streptomyces]|uniref:hypothetical protein n=1 Tax=unclassified Streptomyces TaxID=2593676 RepID=UPI0032537557